MAQQMDDVIDASPKQTATRIVAPTLKSSSAGFG